MPLVSEFDQQLQVLKTTFVGEVTGDEFSNYFEQTIPLIQHLDEVLEYVDMSKFINKGHLTQSVIDSFFERVLKELQDYKSWKTVFVTSDDKFCFSYFYLRLCKYHVSKEVVKIFNNEKEAMTFLLQK